MRSYWKEIVCLAMCLNWSTMVFSVPTIYTVSQGTDSSVSSGGSGSGTSGDLRFVLNSILNTQAQEIDSTTYEINFTVSSVSLGAILPPINLFNTDTIIIGNSSGSPTIIDGNSLYRPFFVSQGDVTFQNLTITNGVAQGGAGGSGGGGGGMGAAGAIFIDQATVTVSNVSFDTNTASAGLGGLSGSGIGGGGGLGASGGSSNNGRGGGGGGGYSGSGGTDTVGGLGGGGSVGNGGNISSDTGGGGGGSAIIGADGANGGGFQGGTVGSYVFGGGGGGNTSGTGGNGGGTNGGVANGPEAGGGGLNGGDGISDVSGGNGGIGGGGGGIASGFVTAVGGAGGTGGGGGGGYNGSGGTGGYLGGGGGGFNGGGGGTGGPGGFGGGGGAGAGYSGGVGTGGHGGTGGGGGGGYDGTGGTGGGGGFGGGGGGSGDIIGVGGVGASDGTNSLVGGDGAAFGGAIFVSNGGSLIVQGICSTTGNGVTPNTGDGAAVGSDLFIKSGVIMRFTPGDGNTITLSGTIADDSIASVPSGSTWTAGGGVGAVLNMQGPGTLVLNGANTYIGGTHLQSGQLTLGNNTALGTGIVLMSDETILAFNGTLAISNSIFLSNNSVGIFDVETSNAATLSGIISGNNASITKIGAGSFTLSTAGLYTGATSISAGTLALIGSGSIANSASTTVDGGATLDISGTTSGTTINTLSGAGDIVTTGKSLTVNQASPGIFSGVISGINGSLTKIGTGQLTLNNTETYTGNTFVNQGALALNGSVVSSMIIAAGATLSGNGTIGGNLISSGTISPGNSIGVTTVLGNFSPTASNIYICEINAEGESDEIVVSQVADLNGTLEIVVLPGIYTGPETYTILTAQGVTGHFDQVILSEPSLFNIILDPTEVILQILPLGFVPLTGNAAAVATCFVTLSGADATVISNALFTLTSLEELQRAFNQMQPSQFSAFSQVQLNNAVLLRTGYRDHMTEMFDPCECGVSGWGDVIGQWTHQDGAQQQVGYNDTTLGATLGVDWNVGAGLLGAAFSYTHDDLRWRQGTGHGQMNSYYGGVYGSLNCENCYFDFSLLGGSNRFDGVRHIDFATIDRTATHHQNGFEWLAGIGASMELCTCDFNMTPYIDLDYVYTHQNGYAETGAGSLDLDVKHNNSQFFQGEVGITFYQSCSVYNGYFTPELTLAYRNQTQLSGKTYHAQFVDSACTFDVAGWDVRRNLFVPRLILAYQSCGGCVNVSLQYDAAVGRYYWTQAGSLQLGIRF